MNTSECYGGKQVHHAPVLPSLLAGPLLTGNLTAIGSKRTVESFIVGGRKQDNSCGGPCVRNELIEMAFGNEG